MSKTPLISIRSLSVEYGPIPVRTVQPEGISFDVERGSFISIVGPSGCGKTTLLRAIAGLVKPTSGSVSFNDRLRDSAADGPRVGFVFQQPVLFPWRTVAENVRLPGELLGDVPTRRDLDRYLELVGLSGFAEHLPHELSGGMQSRVAIARALIHNPEILLLDEPFADLDEVTRERLNLELLQVWHETGTTAIFVTHNLEEAIFLADEVHVLSTRPPRVAASTSVTLTRPRSLELMESDEFAATLRVVRKAARSSTTERP